MSEAYQEYVSHFQLRQEQLAARVSDQHILELADKIIRWEEDLVGPLELTGEEINDIHEEITKPKLKRYQLFLFTLLFTVWGAVAFCFTYNLCVYKLFTYVPYCFQEEGVANLAGQEKTSRHLRPPPAEASRGEAPRCC